MDALLSPCLASLAASARHSLDNLYLLSGLILDQVPDEDETLVAAVRGIETFEAGVVGVKGIVMYSSGVHRAPPLWAGLRGASSTRGAISSSDAHILLCVSTFVYEYARMFP